MAKSIKVKKSMPARSNKGGAVRGKARAASVKKGATSLKGTVSIMPRPTSSSGPGVPSGPAGWVRTK